jgi:CopG family nickel-responsive transcriptional regulator
MGSLARFSVAMDEDLLTRFDALVAHRGSGVNRSEAVRDLVRDALVDAEWEDSSGEIVGTITMVFDHHASDLSDKLDTLQHAHHERIISSMHVHLDAHNCLEVIVVRGTGAQVRAIADGLLGTKGVKHGKLVSTTTGRHL